MSRYRFLVEDALAPAARLHGTVPKPSAPTKEGGRTSGLRLALLLLACFAVIHAMAVVRMESASRASATPLESPVRLAPRDSFGACSSQGIIRLVSGANQAALRVFHSAKGHLGINRDRITRPP